MGGQLLMSLDNLQRDPHSNGLLHTTCKPAWTALRFDRKARRG